MSTPESRRPTQLSAPSGAPVTALLVDARPVDHPTARQRGIGRYVTGLLRGLTAINAPLIALYGSDVEAEVLADAIPSLRLARWSPQIVRDHATAGTWYVATQLMLHPIPLDPIPRVITEAHLPVAAVMYDVIPYRFPDEYQVEPSARRQAQLRAPLARTVDTLLAISHFAAETAAQELNFPLDRIGMIGAGVDSQFTPATSDPRARSARVLPSTVGRYVVAVTGGDERKNTEGLLRAWGLVDPTLLEAHHLVIATAHSPTVLRRWEAWAAEAGIADRVIFTGSISDDEMVATLQGATLAVMPSFEEGFGLPVVEAAACGVAAICSNMSSLPEVLDESSATFDPRSPAAIAKAIARALTDESHRRVLLAAGARAAERWTWQRVASDTIHTLESLGPRWTQRIVEPSRRLAIAGPFVGSGSGIGQYDASVLNALAECADVPELVALVDGSATSVPTATMEADEGRAVWPARALGRYVKPWDVDHVIAVLGSSPHHVATAELAAAVPCHVWLHEASLVGVHLGLAHASGSHGWATQHINRLLEANESSGSLAALDDDEILDAVRLHELDITLLGPTLRRSRSVIVSSDRAASVVRSVRPDGPALLVLPLASPATSAPSIVPGARDIVAAGWLAENKLPTLAVEVLARLVATQDATLTFVGSAAEGSIEDVGSVAEQLGVGDRVTFTGRLDDDAYRRRLGVARVGLQLRVGGGGEMSAAVGDLVAAGIPTVTSLTTARPSSAGLQVVHNDVDSIVAAITPLLLDDELWAAASADALARAEAWTFDDVAQALLTWLDDIDSLDAATIRRVGPAVVSPAPHA